MKSRRSTFGAITLPFVLCSLAFGCPHQPNEASPTDAAPIPSTSVVPAASSAWPKTFVTPPPVEPEPPEAIEDLDASLDADTVDADDAVDASLAAADAADADAKPKFDAYDDAALMGTKTFVDENPTRGIRKITSGAAKVHKAPKDHDVIATLPKGTEVSLVAEIFDWYRIRYTDPNTGIRRQGWVYVINFAGPRQKSCPVGWTHHPQDGGWCDRECVRNTDCRALKGYKCSGTMCFYAGE